jgi:hypothetical protein
MAFSFQISTSERGLRRWAPVRSWNEGRGKIRRTLAQLGMKWNASRRRIEVSCAGARGPRRGLFQDCSVFSTFDF